MNFFFNCYNWNFQIIGKSHLLQNFSIKIIDLFLLQTRKTNHSQSINPQVFIFPLICINVFSRLIFGSLSFEDIESLSSQYFQKIYLFKCEAVFASIASRNFQQKQMLWGALFLIVAVLSQMAPRLKGKSKFSKISEKKLKQFPEIGNEIFGNEDARYFNISDYFHHLSIQCSEYFVLIYFVQKCCNKSFRKLQKSCQDSPIFINLGSALFK